MDGGNEVEEIHRIDIECVAQVGARIDGFQVDFGRDIAKFLLHHGADIDVTHSLSGSCSSLPISARNSAPPWPSLTR